LKKLAKKLSLRKETLLNLKKVSGGRIGSPGAGFQDDVLTDTDTDTFPSGGGDICWISDCNPCESQLAC